MSATPLTGGRVPARLRSLLFAPASRPDVLAKLPRTGPDGVVIDLEDAVPAEAKAAARPHARAAGTELATAHPDMAVYVRVNAVPTEWFAQDVADGVAPEISGIVVPKLESPHQIETVVDALERAGLGHLHIFAGIETAQGVESARELFRSPVRVAYFGAEDYIADLGGIRTPGNAEVAYARAYVAMAARLAGVPALDLVTLDFGDGERFTAEALEAWALGYAGKLCIHPAQVALANEAFRPSADELDWAGRLLAAFDGGGGVTIAFEGQMVDEVVAARARAILASAPDD